MLVNALLHCKLLPVFFSHLNSHFSHKKRHVYPQLPRMAFKKDTNEEIFPVVCDSRCVPFMISFILWHHLHVWPLFRLTCEAVWACGIPLVTLWYLGARAWSDEKRQISYSVSCAGKGRVERQILRTAWGRGACQLRTRHQTAASGSPWQITRVWSSRGTVPARWLMFEEKSTLAHTCTRVHTWTAV